VNLYVDGQLTQSATGDDSGTLRGVSWDVHGMLGHTAYLQVVDNATGAWGHLMLDQVVMGDHPNAAVGEPDVATAVNLVVGGQIVRTITGQDNERLAWTTWDVSDFSGQTAHPDRRPQLRRLGPHQCRPVHVVRSPRQLSASGGTTSRATRKPPRPRAFILK
jgi:hypothetical protein